MSPLLGCHVSIAGGIYRAVERGERFGCPVVQIFTRNQRRWDSKPLDPHAVLQFRKKLSESGVVRSVLAHGSYLLNPATGDKSLAERTRDALADELSRCEALGIDYLVIHPGSHGGDGEQEGVRRITALLKNVLASTGGGTAVCIETTAGGGGILGCRFEHIRDILDGTGDRVAVCMDTCHIFAAGYDIRTRRTYRRTLGEFDRIVGLGNLKVLHLNDSKFELGSKRDRHEHIGMGTMGKAPFSFIMRDNVFRDIPKIIETPKEPETEGDMRNLSLLRDLARGRGPRGPGRGMRK